MVLGVLHWILIHSMCSSKPNYKKSESSCPLSITKQKRKRLNLLKRKRVQNYKVHAMICVLVNTKIPSLSLCYITN